MENLQKEIAEAIDKNLPNQVGELLKKRLEKADSDAVLLEQQRKNIKNQGETIGNLEEKLNKHLELDTKHNFLLMCEKELIKQANSQKVFEAELKMGAANSKVVMLQDLMQTVFRSPVYKKHIDKWDSFEHRYENNMNIKEKTGETVTETTEEE